MPDESCAEGPEAVRKGVLGQRAGSRCSPETGRKGRVTSVGVKSRTAHPLPGCRVTGGSTTKGLGRGRPDPVRDGGTAARHQHPARENVDRGTGHVRGRREPDATMTITSGSRTGGG